MENNPNLISSELLIDDIVHTHLKETAMWSRFLGIVGFIFSALYAVIAIFAGTFMSAFTQGMGSAGMMGAGTITVVYLIIAAIGFVVSLFMIRFASNMKAALLNTDQESLSKAFLNLKFVYRFYGIVMIIALAFMVIAFIVGIGAAVFATR